MSGGRAGPARDDGGTGPGRPAYALTRGRTRPSGGRQLPLESVLTVTELAGPRADELSLEARRIVAACASPQSVAEIGALLQVPVGVARVLVSELAGAGFLQLHLPPDVDRGPGEPSGDQEILGRLLDGLRAR